MKLNVNGKDNEVDAEPDTPLLWALREQLNLTGTKFGCGLGQCGACTVHIDGVAVRSCIMPLAAIGPGVKITTIEGLSEKSDHPVQRAWEELDVPQCGYCQSGMIMASAALLDEISAPSNDDISNMVTNICRCGTFVRVREGIHLAANLKKSEGEKG
jgi:isoquinoline 1-oxidoreductase alpha subunit